MLTVYYVLVFTFVGLFSISVILAFWWAVRRGEMRDFDRQAAAIFDEDEPEGRLNDVFPGMRPPARSTRKGTHVR